MKTGYLSIQEVYRRFEVYFKIAVAPRRRYSHEHKYKNKLRKENSDAIWGHAVAPRRREGQVGPGKGQIVKSWARDS